jgi:DNA-binding transcriptional LysR family regulator
VESNSVLAASGVELRHLRALIALSDELHYGRAAIRLHLAQSTLSRTIVDLEGLVGTPLVERTRRSVALTAAGRALVGAAEEALGLVQEGVCTARTAPLTLGIVGRYGYRWMPALRARLGDEAPTVRSIAPGEGFDALTRGVALAIGPLPIVPPAHLATQPLACTDCWVALPRIHHLTVAERVPFARIAREPLLLPEADPLWIANVELIFRAHGLPLLRGPEASCMAEILSLVSAGAGWSLVPTREEFHPWDGIERRRISGLDRTTIALVWDSARMTPEVQRVVDALLDITTSSRELRSAA